MKNRTRFRQSAMGGFSAVLLVTGVAFARDTDTCERRLERASGRSVAATLKCMARARRLGDEPSPACISRAGAALLAGTDAGDSACSARAAALADRGDACVSTVAAVIPGVGRCAARKLAAAGRWYRAGVLGRRSAGDTRSLCGAFERAGDCPGECVAVRAAFSSCMREASEPPVEPGLPAPAPDDLVVAFGSYEGDAVSTASTVGQDDVTSTSRVVVEPGATRLYVVLSSYEARIWRFEGETARVGRVVVLGYGRQGVTGLGAERVTDLSGLPDSELPRWYEDHGPEASAARAAIEVALGRAPDVFAGGYQVGSVTLPSAAVTTSPFVIPEIPPDVDPWIFMMGTFYRPGGVVEVEPAAVVPAGLAEPYVVLPQEFGLVQLLASGALESREGSLYIAQPMRFPAGLAGAHQVTFVLGRGVPSPEGDPGHSCVLSEETGLAVGGTYCWQLPPDPGATCEMAPALPGDRLVVFGAYEGDAISTTAVAGQDEVTATVRVNVEAGTEPLYVVLSAFDSTIWRFEGDTARIRRVVLVGVRDCAVTGIAAENVVDLSEEVDLLPESVCFAPFWDTRSPEGVVARGVVERTLGRAVDVLAASYEVGTVALPSGTVTPTPPALHAPAGFDPTMWQAATWFSPGGIVDVPPAAVVPSDDAEPYVVLPRAFGLAQLVATGALELRGESPILPTLYIAQPIPRFPAGLHGAASVRFILGRGVPMPAGSPGHSCVISEETGLPLGEDILCSFYPTGD
jgi:hypothetical protein